MLRLKVYLVEKCLVLKLSFTKMAHGILLVAVPKWRCLREGKSYEICNCFELKNRDLNLSLFQEIEPDQMKKFLQLERKKKSVAELEFEPVPKSFDALRAC